MISLCTILASLSIDHLFYDKLILTPYEFVKVNILSNVASEYGTNGFHWYVDSLSHPNSIGILVSASLLCSRSTVYFSDLACSTLHNGNCYYQHFYI